MYMMEVNHVRAGSKGTLKRDPGDATLSLDMTEAVQTLEAPPVKKLLKEPGRTCAGRAKV